MTSAAAATAGEGPRADTLSVLLPTAGETELLAACLHQGSRAREAWARWCSMHDPSPAVRRDRLAATRTMMPLLCRSAARNDLDLGHEVSSYVRAAALREELRAARYAEIVADALAALRTEDARVYVARGAVLAASAYDAWALRHCHDLDLLVSPECLPAAVRALGGIGSVVRSWRLVPASA